MALVRLAGGILWRTDAGGPRLAVIHRPRQRDWSLPKGRLDDGESWEEAALREVQEETGCEARITSFAGAAAYVPRRTPRLALYWHLALVREGKLESDDEVDELLWLSPTDALARLDHEPERRLIERSPSPPGARQPSRPRGALAADVAAVRAEILRRVPVLGEGAFEPVALGAALGLLDQADDELARERGAEAAARLVASARRMGLLSLSEPELSLRARTLREEAREIAPGRRRAVRGLLPQGERPSPEAVYLAAEIVDEERERPARSVEKAGLVGAAGAALALAAALFFAPPDARGHGLFAALCGALGGAACALVVSRRLR
jgi:8-oxo-dGTP pyrophosphatase MutT (NUDIX family)